MIPMDNPNLRKRAVFLDRDGVLNRAILQDGEPRSPLTIEGFRIASDAAQATAALRSAGYLNFVVTNQPNVARGLQTISVVESFHDELQASLSLDGIYVCYHDDRHDCNCRKPRPGLLIKAASEWDLGLEKSFMVGDRQKDLEAGRRVGCQTILIRQSYNTAAEEKADYVAASLSEAADWILEH